MNISYLNPLNIFLLLIFTFSLQIFLFNFFNKINLFTDKDFSKPQSYHFSPTPRIGGVILFLPLLFYFIKDIINLTHLPIYLICIVCFLIGLLDDVKYVQNAKKKFLLLSVSIFILSIFFDLKIINFGNEFLQLINNNFLMSSFLFFCCIFVVVNGANLIDGFNGLLILNLLIISTSLLIVSKITGNDYVYEYSLFFIISLIFLLYLNFPHARIFMGDSGAYFSGAFIGLMSIELNSNPLISPFFLASLNVYFFTEILFSIIRKSFEKKSPFQPDNMHLHMLIYRSINKKFNKKISNFVTSIVINFFFMLFVLVSLFFYNDNFICKILFFSFIILYLLVYFFLRKYNA